MPAHVLVAAALLAWCLPGCAQEPNIALRRPYTLVPQPNYPYCTDDGDMAQLTDGLTVDTADGKQLWVNQGCVGWKTQEAVEVIIDLGSVHPVASVTVSSGSGPGAGVYLPSVTIAVSDDGVAYHVVGEIDASQSEQRSRVWMQLDELRTRGRYVLVRLTPPYGDYVFCDEIAILRGDHDPAGVVLPEAAVAPLQADTTTELQRRLLKALDRLRERAEEGAAEARLVERVARMRDAVLAAPTTLDGKFQTMDTVTARQLSEQVSDLQRDVARAITAQPRVRIWEISPWADVLPCDPPPGAGGGIDAIHIIAGRREYESRAFMVSNLTDTEESLQIGLEGPLAGDWGGDIALRHAVFVGTPEAVTLSDALPVLDHPLTVPAWESRMIWLQVHSGDAPVGIHAGTVTVTFGDEARRVPLRVEVLPVAMPPQVPIATYSWQYVDSIATLQGIESEAIADLATHYNSVNILSNHHLPKPRNDQLGEDGSIIGELDFTELDRILDACKSISSEGTGWFPSFTYKQEIVADSPEYRTFSQSLTRLVAHLKDRGLGHDDFFVYPVDESIRIDFLTSARAIRSVDPQVRIFADPMMRDADEHLHTAAPYADIWSPMLDARHPRQYEILRETGATMWSYFVGRRSFCPYAAYRLALWKAFAIGARGCGFWCYAVGDKWRNTNMWAESALQYAAIYTLDGAPADISRAEKIIPSRRWEAWREGIEDYTWLFLLRQAVERRTQAVGQTEQTAAAEKVLIDALDQVLRNPDDLSLADAQSEKVMRALMELEP